MQFLDIRNRNFEEKPKAKPVPPEEYTNRTVYVQYNIEHNYLFTSLLKKVAGSFLVGEL